MQRHHPLVKRLSWTTKLDLGNVLLNLIQSSALLFFIDHSSICFKKHYQQNIFFMFKRGTDKPGLRAAPTNCMLLSLSYPALLRLFFPAKMIDLQIKENS